MHPEEDKKEAWRQASETQEQMDTDELGMIKQWVGSKKMINRENESRRLIKAPKKLRAHSNMPLVGDKFVNRIRNSSFCNIYRS